MTHDQLIDQYRDASRTLWKALQGTDQSVQKPFNRVMEARLALLAAMDLAPLTLVQRNDLVNDLVNTIDRAIATRQQQQ